MLKKLESMYEGGEEEEKEAIKEEAKGPMEKITCTHTSHSH